MRTKKNALANCTQLGYRVLIQVRFIFVRVELVRGQKKGGNVRHWLVRELKANISGAQ